MEFQHPPPPSTNDFDDAPTHTAPQNFDAYYCKTMRNRVSLDYI